MTTEENIAQREMTLREFVERLPEGHRVRIELAALEADNAAKDVAIRGAIAKSPGHGPLWYGSKEMDCLRAALTPDSGKVVESTGHSVTRYRIESKRAGVFTLTSARGLPR